MSTDNVQRNLKVLCVIDQLALGGGAEQLLATLVPEIRKRGIDIEVATLIPWTPDLSLALEAQGVMVHRVNAKNLRKVSHIVRGLAAITRKGAFDLVWSHQRVAGLLLRVAELHRPASRHIVTLHSEGYAKLRITSLRSRLTLLAERFLLKRTKKIAVSGAVAADYAAYATVYAYSGYAVNDPASFDDEFTWQVEKFRELAASSWKAA